ncbi:MAG TPA: polysaccharide deacetylase family protein [Terriglobia bacterium]|nr:polysaccharide deacetylase family protein [Terriglobia bacterium]
MNPWGIVVPGVAALGLPAWAGLHPRSQLFGSTRCTVENACALTFDDGPNPRITPHLLALLEKHCVPATFFVLGKYVEQCPTLAAEIVAANHAIGNHTYGHPSLLFFTRRQIIEELTRCEDAVFGATGRYSSCVRPPFGFRGPQFHSAAREVGLSEVVMWSVSGRDWKPQPAARVSHRIRKVQSGDIVLLHDGDHRLLNADRSHMIQALEYWLPRWKDSGLQFVKLCEDSLRPQSHPANVLK